VSGSSLSRRVLLLSGGVAAAAGMAGCDLDPTSSAPVAQPSPDPDQALVTAARAELSELIRRLRAGTGTASLVAVHRVQLAALQGTPPPVTGDDRPLPPAQVVARERRAADRFTRWATTCESGDLARVLASIAAGIRMQPVMRSAT
jgi:hypothetical protein